MISPNVTCKVTDVSEVKPRGMNSAFLHIDTAAFQSGRRAGKSILAAKITEAISSRWGFLYYYGDVKTPELYYAASNPAFRNSKNKLPRGVERKLARIEKSHNSTSSLGKAMADFVKASGDRPCAVRRFIEQQGVADVNRNIRSTFESLDPACGSCAGPMSLAEFTPSSGTFVCKSCGGIRRLSPTGRTLRDPYYYPIKVTDEIVGDPNA